MGLNVRSGKGVCVCVCVCVCGRTGGRRVSLRIKFKRSPAALYKGAIILDNMYGELFPDLRLLP